MTSVKHLLRVKALLLLTLCLSIARTVNSAVLNTTSQTPLVTREELIGLGRALANCPNDGKPCNNTFGADSIIHWLKVTNWRNPARNGFDTLDFSDFEALHKRYGNALAKLHSVDLPSVSGKITARAWAWNIFPDGELPSEGIIVLDRVVPEPPYTVTNPWDRNNPTSMIPNPIWVPNPYYSVTWLAVPLTTYAARLAQLMAANKEGRVSVNQFVAFMLSKSGNSTGVMRNAERNNSSPSRSPAPNKSVRSDKRLEAKTLLEQGEDLMRQKKYREAVGVFSKIIQISPDTKEHLILAYVNRAWAKLELQDYSGAIGDSSSAVELSIPLKLYYDEQNKKKIGIKNPNKGMLAETAEMIRMQNPANEGLIRGYAIRGIAKRELGDKTGACEDYRKYCVLVGGTFCRDNLKSFCN